MAVWGVAGPQPAGPSREQLREDARRADEVDESTGHRRDCVCPDCADYDENTDD